MLMVSHSFRFPYLESPEITVKSSNMIKDQTVVSRCFSVRPVDIRVKGWPVTTSHNLMVSGEPENSGNVLEYSIIPSIRRKYKGSSN